MVKQAFVFAGLFLLSALPLFAVTGYIDHNQNGAMDPYENPRLDLEKRIVDLIPRLTLEEKVAVMSGRGLPVRLFRNPHNEIKADVAQRAAACTQFPQDIALGATWDVELVHEVEIVHDLEGIARLHDKGLPEGKEEWGGGGGGDGNLARDPRWGRTDHLSKSECPYLTAVLGSVGMVGAYNEENRRMDGSMTIHDQRLIRDYYQAPLIRAFNTGNPPEVLMAAYHAINGVPNCANRFLLTDFLRTENGYYGYVTGDEMAVRKIALGHRYTATLEQAAAAAVKAGVDVDESGYPLLMTYDDNIIPILKKSWITEAMVDHAVADVVRIYYKRGLLDPAGTVHNARIEFSALTTPWSTEIPYSIINCEKHKKLALQAARECIVLLKNDRGFLPLDRNKIKQILLAGAADDQRLILGGFGAYPYGRKAVAADVTPLSGISRKLAGTSARVVYEKTLENIIKAARESDVAVFFTSVKEGETFDRLNLHLSEEQETQIQAITGTGIPLIICIIGGNCIFMESWYDKVPAIITAWYPGQEGGHAIADVLFGDYNPGGRLPVTFYRSQDQLADFQDYDITKSGMTYLYMKKEPLFPFGYGLSYTQFAYDHLTIKPSQSLKKDIQIKFDVKNTGTRDGDEVAQVYVHDVERSTDDQPVKQLVGFSRFNLKQGEVKSVTIPVKLLDLAFHDAQLNHVVEPGQFDLMVGSSSLDLRLKGSFAITKRLVIREGYKLTFSNLNIPKQVNAAEPFDIAMTVTNSGQTTADPEVKVYADGNWIASKKIIASIGGQTDVNVTSTLYAPGAQQIVVESAGWKSPAQEILVQRPRPAAFQFTDLSVAATALVDEKVPITAWVRNIGSYQDVAQVTFYLDQTLVESRTVTLAPGEKQKVDFSRVLELGDHTISIGNLPAQSVVIGQRGVVKVIADVSGHGYDGSVKGDPLYAKGKFGRGLLFDGQDDYIYIPHNLFRYPMTITLWVKNFNANPAAVYLYGAANENGNGYGPDPETHVAADMGRHMFFCGAVPGPREGGTDIYGSAISERQWDFLTVVLDQTARFYVNGEEIEQKTFSPQPLFDKYYFTYLGRPARETRFFNGVMDEIRIYDRVLSLDEIRQIQNDNADIREGQVFHMNFDQ
jgi:beta-glucosidase